MLKMRTQALQDPTSQALIFVLLIELEKAHVDVFCHRTLIRTVTVCCSRQMG